MRSHVHLVWLDFERGSGERKRTLEETLSKFEHSAMNAWKKGGAAVFRKTAGTSGFHVPCTSRQVASHLVRKSTTNRGLDLVRGLHGAVDFLQHDRLHWLRLQHSNPHRTGNSTATSNSNSSITQNPLTRHTRHLILVPSMFQEKNALVKGDASKSFQAPSAPDDGTCTKDERQTSVSE